MSLNTLLASSIDTRLTPPDVEKSFWSQKDFLNGIAVRNSRCWGYGLDFSCESPFDWPAQDDGTSWGGARLISPWHWIQNTHLYSEHNVFFVNRNGVVVQRSAPLAQAVAIPGADLTIGLMNEPIMDIQPARFLAPGWEKYITNYGQGIPVAFFDKEENLLVGEIETMTPAFSQVRIRIPSIPRRAQFHEYPVFGDSSNGIYLLIRDVPVAISGWWNFGGGPAYANYLSQIQAAMDQLKPGFQLQTLDLARHAPRARPASRGPFVP